MAWIYLAESEDCRLRSCRGCEQSPTVKTIDTPNLFYCPACGLENFVERLSGMTCEHCAVNWSSALVSTSSTAGSPARTSVLRDLEQVWAESEAGYSLKSQDWLANCDRDSSSWKTSQLSLLEDSPTYVWPSLRSGTIVDGRLYQPQKLEPSIFENDGSYLPTPTACDYGKNVGRKADGSPSGRDRWSITVLAKCGKIPGHPRGKLNPEWLEQAMGYPIAWTELADWATQWFRPKRGKRS